MNQDIRWKQRYSNFKKAYDQLTEFMEVSELNKFEVQGLIQCFEYTFELSWKTLKDYLEHEGYDVKTPREVIKKAYQVNIIEDGVIWLDALEKRNLMSHTYNEQTTLQTKELITSKYYQMIKKLVEYFSKIE
ncbi:MAG TPA: nucleotidyltransferase substrate binding protein [Leptospiraceae bacterium]|nr:nucleotidyltransferase substrate binding protein [Leptospiraceae bacterium]HMW03487.1 nucleotidyltransferase substrate binding protein [Leptospiraceae bacterium]HMX34720.1 nucleotidyltransferase substrate binding protein [Leptospiraceae bacterium]HMY29593.1 nucleotidyltransferase substrate binding protein [Leptospiraceae bacterium]HMZ62917.1 nucleotidyltransferase substrate binding protein [Leptospiraceae bacterium]